MQPVVLSLLVVGLAYLLDRISKYFVVRRLGAFLRRAPELWDDAMIVQAVSRRVPLDVARDVMQTVPGGDVGFEPLARFRPIGDLGIGFSEVLGAGIAIPLRAVAPPRREPDRP